MEPSAWSASNVDTYSDLALRKSGDPNSFYTRPLRLLTFSVGCAKAKTFAKTPPSWGYLRRYRATWKAAGPIKRFITELRTRQRYDNTHARGVR